MIQNLIEHVIKSIVERQEEVSITRTDEDQKIIIDVHVAADDIKRVIGREGRTIRSIRSLAHAISNGKSVDIVIENSR